MKEYKSLTELIPEMEPDEIFYKRIFLEYPEAHLDQAHTVEEIEKMNPEAIFLSPGPGRPKDAGICIHVIEKLGKTIPIFGVCLGHQSICEAFGGEKRLCSLRERICHIHDRSNEKSIGIFYSLSHKI